MKKIKESPVLITIVTLLVIVIIYCIFMFIKINIESLQGNMQVSTNIVDEKYHSVSYFLENNSKDKIEKVVADIDISSDDMQSIYEEKEKENINYNSYTIWFFSSDERAKTADKYELGSATRKNGIIEVVNIKEQEAEKEYEEYQKEIEEEEQEKKQEEEKKFKEDCKTYTFEELARNPDKVKGKKVKLTGEVIQVSENYVSIGMRVNITKDEYGWYEDTVYIIYYPEDGEDKILEDDIVTVYGTAEGEYSYTSVLGAYITIPKILAEYVEIN